MVKNILPGNREKRSLMKLFFLSCTIIGISYSAIMAFAPPLKVVGNTIRDANNNVVRLEGFAVYDASNWKDKSIVANWKNNWKVNVIRLTLHPWIWYYSTPSGAHPKPEETKTLKSEAVREEYLKTVDNMLEWCKENKLYVIFDGYHESGSTGSVAQHWDYVKNVWPILAKRYKDVDHIIWEVYNEPYSISWKDWVPKAKELVDIIRSYKPVVTACIVPGVDWATELDFNVAKLERDQIVYSFHIYPHVYNHVWEKSNYKETYNKKFGFISKDSIAPIYIGEWHAIDDKEIKEFAPLLTSYMKDVGASHTQWGYFPGWGKNLVDNQRGQPEQKSAQGTWLYNYFNSVTPTRQAKPNTFTDQVSPFKINGNNISFANIDHNSKVRIFDMQGQLLFSCSDATRNSGKSEVRILYVNHSNGNYLLELTTDGRTDTRIFTIKK